MQSIRRAPMTAEVLIACVAVYASCLFQSTSYHQKFADVQRAWGAIVPVSIADAHDGVRRSKETELTGPIDVWNGDWWRIPATAFHHDNLFHLVLCLGATWYLGSRLEQRWGSFVMAMFLIPAICIPVMVELCWGQPVVGFSGAACAILGALVVLRHYDSKVAEVFSEDAAEFGSAMIVIGLLATMGDLISLPNAAHLGGFIYGASLTAITCGVFRRVFIMRVSAVLVHVWLIPALFLVCFPNWIGRYHWYQAVALQDRERAERRLERAVECDPSLAGAWLHWSRLAEEQNDPSEAWKRLVKGLSLNPTSSPLIDGTRRLWRHLDLRGRRNAEQILEDVFGRRASAWLAQIRTTAPAIPDVSDEDFIRKTQENDASEFSLDRRIELPTMDSLPVRSNPQLPKIPIEQNDASEGETL